MRVLISGGAGFIGSHVVAQLVSQGHEPFVVDDLSSGSQENLTSDVPFFEIDVRHRLALRRVVDEVHPDCVCHQAAQMSVSRSVREPVFDAEVNVIGLLNMLELSAEHGVGRFVFASSGGVLYGDVHKPAGEDHPADPISPYGISKWVGEKYVEFFTREHSIQGVALRYANVYGPRQNPHGEAGVVAIFCTRMMNGAETTINGDGSIVRDFVYVEDVARANVLAMESQLDSPFVALNVGTSNATTINFLAAELHRGCIAARQARGLSQDVPAPSYGPARAGDLQSSLVDASRAKQVFGWQPQVPLADGLDRTVTWFSQQSQ